MTDAQEAPGRPLTIGIDIGGTKILGVLFDPVSSVVIDQRQRPTPRHDIRGLIGAVADLADHLITVAEHADHEHAAGRVTAIGIGLPGLVDRRGILRYGPNVPGVIDLDLATDLQQRFGLPTVAENDAANAALAEHRLGAARGADHVIVVTQGTGIGGAIIVDGRLLRGANGFAGEPGHMLVDRSGPICACGRVGCWETVSSGTGLANLARLAIARGQGARILELAGGDPAEVRGEHVSAANDEGDQEAGAVISQLGFWVATGLGSLITLLDPELIVLGGGLTAISDRFLDDVRSQVMTTVVGGAYRPTVPIVAAALGPAAGAIGGAILAADLPRSDGW